MAISESDFNVQLGSVAIGKANTLTITRPNSSNTFHLQYTVGAVSAYMTASELTVLKNDSGCVTYSWVPDSALLWQLPDVLSLEGTLTVHVDYDSAITPALNRQDVLVFTKAFTAFVPPDVVPAATLRVSVVNDNPVLSDWGLCVRDESRLAFSAAATPGDGATVTGGRFSCGTLTAEGLTGTTDVLRTAGTLVPAITVTDSRERSAVISGASISVWDYQLPTLRSVTVRRCDAEGTQAQGGAYFYLCAAAACSPLDGRNSATLRYRIRQAGGTWGAYATLLSGVGTVVGGTMDAAAAYEVELSAVDTVGSVRAVCYTSSTEAVAFHLRAGGNGAAFGKTAESEGLSCLWDAAFDGDVEVAGALRVGGHTLWDLMYPVGAVYLSVSAAEPSTLFGGTWQRIEDCFLLCAGTGHAAAQTGGAETITLTQAQLPSHNHTVTGETSMDNWTHGHSIPDVSTGGSGSGVFAESWGGGSGERWLETRMVPYSHTHTLDLTTGDAGSGQSVNVMPPYLTVYAWQRTA